MPSVLFICTGNQFRSPLASAIFSRELVARAVGGEWLVDSAGTWTISGNPLPGSVIQAAKGLGLNGLAAQRTRQVELVLLSKFDICIVMEGGHKEALASEFPSIKRRIFLLSEIVEGVQYDIPDPARPDVELQAVVSELDTLIHAGAKNIVWLARQFAMRR